jgi:DNA repair photolyase
MPAEKIVNSVLNKHKKRDTWFLDDYSVNPYEGCSINCIYCYIRGSKYGLNMDKKLAVKINSAEILERQLASRAKKGQYGIIAVSSATDPYIQPEEKFNLTRKFLEIILKYRFPVFVSSKSTLILRDLAILKEIDEKAILPDDLKKKVSHGAIITTSISTLDERVSKIIEPAAASPADRLNTIKKFKEKGFFAGVNFIPVLPYISDSKESLEQMITGAKNAGADFVFIGGLTLFGNSRADSKTLYFRFIDKYYPHLSKEYRSMYYGNYFYSIEYEHGLRSKAEEICKKHGVRIGIY